MSKKKRRGGEEQGTRRWKKQGRDGFHDKMAELTVGNVKKKRKMKGLLQRTGGAGETRKKRIKGRSKKV